MMGKANPAVFPVPVCADASTSFLSRIRGIAFSWMVVGDEYPFLLTAFNKGSDNPTL